MFEATERSLSWVEPFCTNFWEAPCCVPHYSFSLSSYADVTSNKLLYYVYSQTLFLGEGGGCSDLVLRSALHTSAVLSGSLSPRHGVSSGCGWRSGLQLWRVAANKLNKQSWTADKGWSSSLGLGQGANNSSL
jgi:hypothetical protein